MPTKESLDRARKCLRDWCLAIRSDGEPNPAILNSLALEFDRIAIEAQLRIVNNLKGAERHEWWEMAQRLKAQLVKLDAEGGVMSTCPFKGPVTILNDEHGEVYLLGGCPDSDEWRFKIASIPRIDPGTTQHDIADYVAQAINDKLARDSARPDTPKVPRVEGA